jgi:hypothetical protein
LAAANVVRATSGRVGGLDQPIAETLVIPLGMTVSQELGDCHTQALLAEEDLAIEALGFQAYAHRGTL